jgi:hypothetical protein
MTNNIHNAYSYKWQPQKQIAWKGINHVEIIPSNARPETNGSWILNQSGGENVTDGNAFLPRPIKHWRKQLSANPTRGGTSGKVGLNIQQVPGYSNYLGGDYDVENNSCENDPSLSQYHIISNISIKKHNTCCKPPNRIRGLVSPIENNYVTTNNFMKSRCILYSQNNSSIKDPNIAYFDPSYGQQLYPNNNAYGPQTSLTKNCTLCSLNNKQTSIYKPNNQQYSMQGGVSSRSRILKLKDDTITFNSGGHANAFGVCQGNFGLYDTNVGTYYVKNKPTKPICHYNNKWCASLNVA